MRLRHRGSRKRIDPAMLRLPLIALIDVVLFLLFYFIISGTIAVEEAELATTLNVERGRSAGNASSLQQQVLRVSGDAQGATFTLGNRVLRTSEALATVLAQLPKEPGIVLRVEGSASVDAAAAAMQAASDAGFTRITYVPAEG